MMDSFNGKEIIYPSDLWSHFLGRLYSDDNLLISKDELDKVYDSILN